MCVSTQSLTNDASFVQWCDTVVDGREGFEGLERRVGSKAAVVAFAIGRVSVQRIMWLQPQTRLAALFWARVTVSFYLLNGTQSIFRVL